MPSTIKQDPGRCSPHLYSRLFVQEEGGMRRRRLFVKFLKILAFVVTFSSIIAITCVSFNHAFPFDLTQLYSTVNNIHNPSQQRIQNDFDHVWTPSPRKRSRTRTTTEMEVTSTMASTTKQPRTTTTSQPETTTMSTSTESSKKKSSTTKVPKKNGNKTSTTKRPKTTAKPKNVTTEVPQIAFPVIMVTNYKKKKITPFPKVSEVVVETKLGKIRGLTGIVMGKDINSFLGVPYAKPPTGNLRFRRTIKIKPWMGVKDALSFSPHCLQDWRDDLLLSRSLTTLEMSEDCLYLNIWSPATTEDAPTNPKPVIVYIHGNGFHSGSANFDETDGRVLAALGDVVVVSFNYRLGPLGFLDLEDEECPGNQGIYDMVTALEVIQEIIGDFGGDKTQVTLLGHYSGAIATGLFVTNPKTRGLFNRAILQSGSPLFQDYFEGRNLKSSQVFVDKVGCSHCVDMKQKMQCLRGKSIAEVLTTEKPLIREKELFFGPTHCESLLPETSFNSLQDDMTEMNVKEILLGSNRDELSLSLVMDFPEMFTPKKILVNITSMPALRDLIRKVFGEKNGIQTSRDSVEYLAEFFFTSPTTQSSYFTTEIPSDIETTENLIRRMYRVFGDAAVGCPVNIFAEELARRGLRVYLYEFNQRALNTPWGGWMGVPLGMEIPYIFGHPLRYPRVYSQDDMIISKRIIATWIHFAKSGKVPDQLNNTWNPFTLDNPSFLEINPLEVVYGSRQDNPVCQLFRVALTSRNDSSSIECNPRIAGGVREDDEIPLESTTESFDSTTDATTLETTTQAVLITCSLFVDDIDGPSIDYYDYEVIDLKIVAVLGTRALFYCEPDQELIGEQVSKCEGTGWTSPKPTCKKILPGSRPIIAGIPRFYCDFFRDPPDDDRLRLRYEKLYEVNETMKFAVKGSLAKFSCESLEGEKIVMIGQNVSTCSKYGIWSSIEPKCQIVVLKKEVFRRDWRRQYFVIGLILVFFISMCYTTLRLYAKMSREDDSQYRRKSVTTKPRTKSRGSSKMDSEDKTEKVVLLPLDQAFSVSSSRSTSRTTASSICTEDLEVIDILARDRDNTRDQIHEKDSWTPETSPLKMNNQVVPQVIPDLPCVPKPRKLASRSPTRQPTFVRRYRIRRDASDIPQSRPSTAVQTDPMRSSSSRSRRSGRSLSSSSSTPTTSTSSSSEAETVLWIPK